MHSLFEKRGAANGQWLCHTQYQTEVVKMKQDKTEMVAQQDGDHQPMIIQKEEGDSGTPVLGYGFKVVIPNVQQLAEAGFEKVQPPSL